MIVRYRDYKGKPGIYKWENLINHKCYIGQSIDLNKRIAHHFSNIKNGKYDNPLYRAINKYGLENFDVAIIEVLENTIYKSIIRTERMDIIKRLVVMEEY